MRLRRLESGDLWLWKAHFDDYWQKLGLERQANEQAQMLPSGVDDEDEKVTRMPRRVPETAGEAAE